MTDREKLIELLEEAIKENCLKIRCIDCNYHNSEPNPCRNELVVDHLITNGVTVREKVERIKFLPCKCGKNSHITWHSPGGVSFECKYCGLQSPAGRTETEARRLWNEMVCGAEGPKEDKTW